MNYAIITENDVSEWNDNTGISYHYPQKYVNLLKEGTRIIYYKGALKDKSFANMRMSNEPHYFGCAILGEQTKCENTAKPEYVSEVINYIQFVRPVPNKLNGNYFENIPQRTNYWRDGARKISEEVYNKILTFAKNDYQKILYEGDNFEHFKDGQQRKVYTTIYERNPVLRKEAIKIHGLNCMVCGFNFEAQYGELGANFIHVHHINPLYKSGLQIINPQTDLAVLCPNCHAMIHRDRNSIMSVWDLKQRINKLF